MPPRLGVLAVEGVDVDGEELDPLVLGELVDVVLEAVGVLEDVGSVGDLVREVEGSLRRRRGRGRRASQGEAGRDQGSCEHVDRTMGSAGPHHVAPWSVSAV